APVAVRIRPRRPSSTGSTSKAVTNPAHSFDQGWVRSIIFDLRSERANVDSDRARVRVAVAPYQLQQPAGSENDAAIADHRRQEIELLGRKQQLFAVAGGEVGAHIDAHLTSFE